MWGVFHVGMTGEGLASPKLTRERKIRIDPNFFVEQSFELDRYYSILGILGVFFRIGRPCGLNAR